MAQDFFHQPYPERKIVEGERLISLLCQKTRGVPPGYNSNMTKMRYIKLNQNSCIISLCYVQVTFVDLIFTSMGCLWTTATKESGQWLDGYCSCCWRLWCESHPIFARGLDAVGVLVYYCIFMLFSLSSLKSYLTWLMWQVKGQEVENFIVAAQDRSKNAHNKSMQAAYSAWVESLRSDQAQFESQRILTPDCTKSHQIQNTASGLIKPKECWKTHSTLIRFEALLPLCPEKYLKKIGTPTAILGVKRNLGSVAPRSLASWRTCLINHLCFNICEYVWFDSY